MRVSVTTRKLGDCVRTVVNVTDGRHLAASVAVDGDAKEYAVDELEELLVRALDAVRKERLRTDSGAAREVA